MRGPGDGRRERLPLTFNANLDGPAGVRGRLTPSAHTALGHAFAMHDYLASLHDLESAAGSRAPSIDRMSRLMAALGDPQLQLSAVHITGTNGKGSTTALCAELLHESGRKVGRYTSPHLSIVNERIAVDGASITDHDLATALQEVAHAARRIEVTPTWFEAITAAAFIHFVRAAVDFAVVEVGMLGRWDATNVLDATVAVVTNVDLDHTEMAGPTKSHIAYEKAGIVRPGATLVLGERDRLLLPLFEHQLPRSILWMDRDIHIENAVGASPGDKADFVTAWSRYDSVAVGLAGGFQRENALLAITGAESILQEPLDGAVVSRVLERASLPGRFEAISRSPLVIVDVAHNPAAASRIRASIKRQLVKVSPRVLVCGLTIGRCPGEFLAGIGANDFDHVVATQAEFHRAAPAEMIATAAAVLCDSVITERLVADAVEAAVSLAGEHGAVVVVGSHYLVGPVRKAFLPCG